MSTLSMRLKQRARMLAAGVALSAATLALIPGVAEATDPTGCVCRLVGDITDTGNPSPGPSDGSQETSDGPDNSAKLVGLQDTSVLNGSEIGNDNVSGNSTGISAPVLSDDSGSEFNNDANSTSSGNGGANSPSGDKQNDADVAGLQDTSAANGAEILNGNVSGNSTGVSAPIASDDSGSQFDNDASSTSNGNGGANSPSGDKQNDADVAGLQDTSVLNGSEIGNDNASGNSVSVSGPVLSDDSGSEFNNDASSTSSGNSGNGGANSPSGDKQNDADVALGQDTSVLNGSEILNRNASGNSTGVSAPVLSDDSGSQFNNDASSTSSGGNGGANSPSGEERNSADIAGLQDTSALNGSEIGNGNASGNSVGVSAPVLSDDSGSQFDNDANSTNGAAGSSGNANSPSGDKQNDADIAGLQDTSAANGAEILNGNASGNSTGVSAPVLSDDSGSEFNNDANSTSSGNGGANSPSGDKQNDADVALGQDTEVANDSRTGNNNASGNSTGVSAPVLSDDSGSQFNNDASSTDNGGTDNGGTDNGGTDNGGTNDSGKKPNSGQGNGDEAGDPGNSQPNNNGGDDGSPNGGQSDKR